MTAGQYRLIAYFRSNILLGTVQALINGEDCARKGIFILILVKSDMKIINNEISTPNQSGPGLTATASGAVSKKGPSGNCWPRIKEQEREETC